MEWPELDHRTGGAALGLGYALVLVILFRNPSGGLTAALTSPDTIIIGIVLPVGGLLAGGYVWLGWPGTAIVGVLAASYLGLWGVVFGLLVTGDLLMVRVSGLVAVSLSVVALLGSLRRVAATLWTE
ncbi:MAG: hypothetical protein ABEH64_11050 [Salinirussus sp.]